MVALLSVPPSMIPARLSQRAFFLPVGEPLHIPKQVEESVSTLTALTVLCGFRKIYQHRAQWNSERTIPIPILET